MTRKKTDYDFVLTFQADGHVELADSDEELIWSSDDDEEFLDEFGRELFNDEDDSENILDYLDEQGLLNVEEDEIDIVENDLADEAASDDEFSRVIEGDFEDVSDKKRVRRKRGSNDRSSH